MTIIGNNYDNFSNRLNLLYGSSGYSKSLKSSRENWNLTRVADEMDVDTDDAASMLASTRAAIKVVDAENPAAAFRESMTQLLTKAAEDGLTTDDAIKNVVTQICYRVSDLGYLLAADNSDLKTFCQEFRREPGDQ